MANKFNDVMYMYMYMYMYVLIYIIYFHTNACVFMQYIVHFATHDV